MISLMPDTFRPSLDAALTTTRDYAGLIGVASIAMLFWIGSSLLGSLSRAFNELYGAPPRAAVAGRALSIGLLFLIPLLFAVTVLISSVAAAMTDLAASFVAMQTQRAHDAARLAQVVALLTSWLLAFVLTLALFWGLPNVRQGFRDVWRGAALAAALIVATDQLFPLYVRFALGNAYSAILFTLAVVTTWAYLIANSLLIGVTVNVFFFTRPAPTAAQSPGAAVGSPSGAGGAREATEPGNSPPQGKGEGRQDALG
jgi:uncharacterized BrkB/YihY/UPF0761 family membrane protein